MKQQEEFVTKPSIGHWYDSEDASECFKVVAYDKSDYVGIQYFDGEIEALDLDTWSTLHPHEIPEPEDASAAFEIPHEDIMEMLNEIEHYDDEALEDHLRHIDDEESYWD